jgi:hypothetical protein
LSLKKAQHLQRFRLQPLDVIPVQQHAVRREGHEIAPETQQDVEGQHESPHQP